MHTIIVLYGSIVFILFTHCIKLTTNKIEVLYTFKAKT